MMPRSSLYTLALLPALAWSSPSYNHAIRQNNLEQLRKVIAAGDVSTPDKRNATPLHYAAAFGSAEAVKLLIASGADVNARDNIGATPLFLAATSEPKAALLLKAGGDPNIAAKSGRTPLHIAAAQPAGSGTVRLLLDAGATVDAESERGGTPLLDATAYGSPASVRLLLERGADAKKVDKANFSTLLTAVMSHDTEIVRLLLAGGADPNVANTFAGAVRHGKIALTGMTPLIAAASHGPASTVRALLDAGAKVNVRDDRGMTPLIAAVSSDHRDSEIVRLLLQAGADPRAEDGQGETVADWARKVNQPEIMQMLARAGAAPRPIPAVPARTSEPAGVRTAVEQALQLVGRSSSEFFRQSGCVGCHHQPLASAAFAKASRVGVHTSDVAPDEMKRSLLAMRAVEPLWMQLVDPGGDSDMVSSVLTGAASAGAEPDATTDAGVRYLLSRQRADGSWRFVGISRPPFEESQIGRTTAGIIALKAYAWPAIQEDVDRSIARARAWLLEARPRHTYERAELLIGLHAAGAPATSVRRMAAELMKDQRSDGGWSQTTTLESDAYATGLALHALHETGSLRASDTAYRKGVKWLLRRQLEDGSWYVRSRSPKFQPFFESGFPHDHEQWISMPATAYAAMALAPAAAESANVKSAKLRR